MTERVDHVATAKRYLPEPGDGIIPGRIAIAQVHATLALAGEVAALRETFGTCPHGYAICPYCIRNAMEGITP